MARKRKPRATEEELDHVHRLVAETLTEALEEGETVLNRDGEPVKISVRPQTLGMAIKYLKDNNIEVRRDKTDRFGKLMEKMSDLEEFDEAEFECH